MAWLSGQLHKLWVLYPSIFFKANVTKHGLTSTLCSQSTIETVRLTTSKRLLGGFRWHTKLENVANRYFWSTFEHRYIIAIANNISLQHSQFYATDLSILIWPSNTKSIYHIQYCRRHSAISKSHTVYIPSWEKRWYSTMILTVRILAIIIKSFRLFRNTTMAVASVYFVDMVLKCVCVRCTVMEIEPYKTCCRL